jgi:hypothetical protein
MGRLRSVWRFVASWFLIAPFFLLLSACGGHKPAGTSPFPVRITLTPSVSYSMQVGSSIVFTASATNAANTAVTPAFTYSSSNPGVVDVSPGGAACAGTWADPPVYSKCTPAQIGTASITASALGSTSAPTLIFVHPPIANIAVTVVPPVNSTPPACPSQGPLPLACDLTFTPSAGYGSPNNCFSQNQIETLQATARDDNGNDITGAVGPFTWSEVNANVSKITPIITVTTNTPAVPTNEATAGPGIPGQTQIIASASGVSSQPYYFATCPVQCIAMELNLNGEQVNNETNFVTTKGNSESITAIAVDVQGCIVPKAPLTWVSSSPAALTAGGTAGCTAGSPCTIAATQTGAGAITASCSPPTCNVGWPLNPEGSTAPYIPEPVYPVTAISGLVTPSSASSGGGTSGSGSGSSGSGSGSGSGSSGSGSGSSGSGSGSGSGSSGSGSGSSGSGTGSSGSGSSSSTTVATTVLVTSQDCYSEALCSVGLYNVPTTTNVPNSSTPIPTPPNSLMFDPAGDRAYLGSQYGALSLNPGSLGTTGSAFTPLAAPGTQLGLVTGRVIGVSQSGGAAVFSDTVSAPNQVYIANVTTTTTTPSSTSSSSKSSSSSTPTTVTTSSNVALNINNATTAAFSPDGLKAFILANGGNSLYVYSALLNLLPPIALPAPATSIVFSSSGSFALLSGGVAPTTYPGTFAIYDTCDDSAVTLTPPATPTFLPSPPQFLRMVPAGNVPTGNLLIPTLDTTGLDFFFGIDDTGIDIIATNSSLPPLTSLCPQTVTLAHTPPPANAPFPPVHVNIGQGTFHPINFFLSPDSTLAYIVATDRSSILVYSFTTRATSAIALANNATPVTASMSADGSLIYVAGSDGLLHVLNTYAAFDEYQISFPPLANSTNSFCYTENNCQMNLLAVKP